LPETPVKPWKNHASPTDTVAQARSLGEGSVGYLEAEVDQWIATRPSARP
jgi:predicted DNA-binding transcriptional regulator AlpA